MKKLKKNVSLYNNKELSEEQFGSRINGWFGYAKFGNTYNFRQNMQLPFLKQPILKGKQTL